MRLAFTNNLIKPSTYFSLFCSKPFVFLRGSLFQRLLGKVGHFVFYIITYFPVSLSKDLGFLSENPLEELRFARKILYLVFATFPQKIIKYFRS